MVANATAEQEVLGLVPREGKLLSDFYHQEFQSSSHGVRSCVCPIDENRLTPITQPNHIWINMGVLLDTSLPNL